MIRILKAVLLLHWREVICNPFFWLSQLASLVVFFTILAATGMVWVAYAVAIIGVILMNPGRAYREWRQERITRRWCQQVLDVQEKRGYGQ